MNTQIFNQIQHLSEQDMSSPLHSAVIAAVLCRFVDADDIEDEADLYEVIDDYLFALSEEVQIDIDTIRRYSYGLQQFRQRVIEGNAVYLRSGSVLGLFGGEEFLDTALIDSLKDPRAQQLFFSYGNLFNAIDAEFEDEEEEDEDETEDEDNEDDAEEGDEGMDTDETADFENIGDE